MNREKEYSSVLRNYDLMSTYKTLNQCPFSVVYPAPTLTHEALSKN